MMLFAQITENHDLVWITLIGAVQAVLLAMIATITSVLMYFVNRQKKQLAENTRLTQETHKMVNGVYSQQLEKTAKAMEATAAATGKTSDKIAAMDARHESEEKKADDVVAKQNGGHPPPHIETR
jgi:uncharacterized protein HemX